MPCLLLVWHDLRGLSAVEGKDRSEDRFLEMLHLVAEE